MANSSVSKDQVRAEVAWKMCNSVADNGQNISSYTTAVKSTASLIGNSGLMQTLAFINSKGDQHYEDLSKHLNFWLARYLGNQDKSDFNSVMNQLLQLTSSQYIQATYEVKALLRWLRQFADAIKSRDN